MSDPVLRPAAKFGIYIHWPFCASKCPYCDFNSHVSDQIDEEKWHAAYRTALRAYRDTIGDRLVSTIYFGGGTPSLMSVDLVDTILTEIRACWPWENDVEITMEANPGSVEADRFAGYRGCGVNRVSLGVQALNDSDLKRLGRLHSADDAFRALETAKKYFDRVSFDLIYARQQQSLDDWQHELRTALGFAPDHLSLYQLTIEPGTAFFARHQAGGLRGLPDEDLGADLYEMTQEMTQTAGLPAYEVSNHARPGQESRHNLIYWHGDEYLGIGPGAHGRLNTQNCRWATETELLPNNWLESVAKNGAGEAIRAELTQEDILNEALMMGLRLRDGISLDRLRALGFELQRAEALVASGHLQITEAQLRTTDLGRPILNAVLRELLT